MTTSKDEDALIAHIAAVASAGAVVAVDPDDADAMAAFQDNALSPEEALESRFDDDLTDGGQ